VLIMRRQRGFNMIEAIVTLAVLGILIASALPSIGGWIRATHVRNLAETTQAGLQKARMEAMRRNQVVTFWLVSPATTARPDSTCALSASSAAWVISIDNPASSCGTAPSTTTLPRIVEVYGPGKGAEGIAVAAVDADGNPATSISFNGYGQSVRTGTPIANIDIAHPDASARRLRVQVTSGGGVRMCDRDVVAPDSRACI
jgi:type IV fimbrial biogenesis protein FimT